MTEGYPQEIRESVRTEVLPTLEDYALFVAVMNAVRPFATLSLPTPYWMRKRLIGWVHANVPLTTSTGRCIWSDGNPYKARNEVVRSTWRPNWAGVIVGSVIAIGALGVSQASFENASRGGGTYVVLWGAVAVGAAMALRGLARTQGSIERAALRRAGEATAERVKRSMTPAEWEATKMRHDLRAGRILSDAQVASQVVAENKVREEEGAARWRRNVARLYGPIAKELKASMTPAEWEAKREDTTWRMKQSRKDALRYWMEHIAPALPPELRTPPEHLNPDTSPRAKDWQVAMQLRPMKLDDEGRPIDPSA